MALILRRDAEYSTSFQRGTADPISEGGQWQSGGVATGGAWSNMQIAGGLCFGTQAGPVSPPYDDSCAIWVPPNGVMLADQEVETQIGIITRAGWTGFHELEHLLRGFMAANFFRCIECLVPATLSTPLQLVQWKGPLATNAGADPFAANPNSFCLLAEQASWPGLTDFDWIKSSIEGNRVRMWHRTNAGVYGNPLIDFLLGTDTPVTGTLAPVPAAGYPGLGHWLNGDGNLGDHVFRNARFRSLS